MASLLPSDTSAGTHACVSFEEKNFQFLGDDGEIFQTAGYECVECSQFYTATGLEQLASERRGGSDNLMQDDLPGLMNEEQGGIDLCLDHVDITDTKQIFQSDPGEGEMDIGAVVMGDQYTATNYSAVVTSGESDPIKCTDNIAESVVAIATSDPGYLIGQPRVDYSQLLVGPSSSTTSMTSAGSNPSELEKHLSGITATATPANQSFHVSEGDTLVVTTSSEAVLHTSMSGAGVITPIPSSLTGSTEESEFHIAEEDSVVVGVGVSDIRDYFPTESGGGSLNDDVDGCLSTQSNCNEDEEHQSNFSISSYSDELQKSLENIREVQSTLEGQPARTTEATEDMATSSEGFEKYLQPTGGNLSESATNVLLQTTATIIDESNNTVEENLGFDSVSDTMADVTDKNKMDSTSNGTDLRPLVDAKELSDNRRDSPMPVDSAVSISSSSLVLDSFMDGRTDSASSGTAGDLNSKELFSEESSTTSGCDDKVGQEEEASGDGGGSGKQQKQHMVLERLIAELENSSSSSSGGGSKTEQGTKVLFLNSNSSVIDTEVSITISKEVTRETSIPEPSKVIDLRLKPPPEEVNTAEIRADDSTENSLDAEVKETNVIATAENATEKIETGSHTNDPDNAAERGPHLTKIARDLNLGIKPPKFPPLELGMPGGKYRTITLYKCKFCNVRFFTRETLEKHSYRAHADRMGPPTATNPGAMAAGGGGGASDSRGVEVTPVTGQVQVKRHLPDQEPQKKLKLTMVTIKQPNQSEEAGPAEDRDVENSYMCYCGQKLKSVEELEEHRTAKHLDDKESEDAARCEQCGRGFSSYQGLNAHRGIHTTAYRARLSIHPATKSEEETLQEETSDCTTDQPVIEDPDTTTQDAQDEEADTTAAPVTTTTTTPETSVTVVRKLFMGKKGNHGDGEQRIVETQSDVSCVTSEPIAVSEASAGTQPLLTVKTEKMDPASTADPVTTSPAHRETAEEEEEEEDEHINSSNLDLAGGDLGEVAQVSEFGLSSLVLCQNSELRKSILRRDIEKDILSITCIRCKKTYSCDEKCNWTLQCSACRWSFTSPAHLQCHYDHFHLHDRDCPLCKFTLSRGSGTVMDRHFKGTHPNQEIFHCYLCETTFTTRACLGNHLSRHFNGTGEHECPHCHMRFEKAPRLNVHKVRNHTLLLGYPTRCPVPEHPTLYMCGVCGRQYEYEGTLRLHLRKHTGGSIVVGGGVSGTAMVAQQGRVVMVAEEGQEEGQQGQDMVEVAHHMVAPLPPPPPTLQML